MRRKIELIAIGALVVLNMGGTCRQETAEAVVNAFLITIATEVAESTGEAISESVVDPGTP